MKPSIPATGTTPVSDRTPRDESPGTLGDLLYADGSKTRVPEREWVEIVQAIAAGDQSALRALYENGPVLGWILNQARSRAIDRLRYEQRRKRVAPHSADPLAASHSSDFVEVLDREGLRKRLRNAVGVLTADEREAIEAAYFSELTYAEVAARLNLPLGTVKTRIRCGLRKLRQVLASD